MVTMTAPASLADVRDLHAGVSYPGHVLEGCETALLFFCAHWHGRQDAYWIADAGLVGTCVDENAERLAEMEAIYPVGWEFIVADAYEFPNTTKAQWDIVSLDPWTNQFQACADLLPDWCSLARRAVILGSGYDTTIVAPDGWKVADVRKRSDHNGGVYWTVLEPA
jgi:hypothetical protein